MGDIIKCEDCRKDALYVVKWDKNHHMVVCAWCVLGYRIDEADQIIVLPHKVIHD